MLKIQLPGGKVGKETIEGTATHSYVERTDEVEAASNVRRAVRSYAKATSASVVSGGKQVRELPAARRTITVRHTAIGPVHFHAGGPLTREELELVSEHFDTLLIGRLLPNKEVAVNDTWPVPDDVARGVGLLEGLTSNSLSGKLNAVDGTLANFTVTGKVEGIEHGAAVAMEVKARCQFDIGKKRVVSLTWEQEDQRGQGPANPAAELTATVTIRREPLAAEPEDLKTVRPGDSDGKVSESQLTLRHADPVGRYTLLYPRAWHITGQTGDHLVLRLIEDGDWVAQATILTLKPVTDGSHTTPAAFKEAIAKQPGWEPAAVSADGEIRAGPGRWLYRVTAAGKQDSLAVVQSFYCLADGKGNQVVVSIVAREERAAKLGGRDVALVTAIEFSGKK